ncbi:MAG: hypothetical protein KKA90_04145 [Nanoarchaeota archaeon]|nr:hypothetical protein [Nanoarchaeota archaeon]
MGAGKIVLGILLVLVGLGLFVDSVYPLTGDGPILGITWLTNFLVVLTGVIPIFLILIGLFLAWIQFDESKSQHEMAEIKKSEKK